MEVHMTRYATSFSNLFACSLLLLILAAPLPAVATDDPGSGCFIEGMVTAAISDDPGFEGLWKYSVTFQWETAKGLSHANVFLALKNCECVCQEGLIQFPDPAAESLGELPSGEPCTAQYVGEYVCMGDPTIPEAMNAPAVKYDAVTTEDGCEPGKTGVGYACFYTTLPPADVGRLPNGVGVKAGQDTCLGDVIGQLPVCDCTVQIEDTTWGEVKGTYR
jgi:hypothetical protein